MPEEKEPIVVRYVKFTLLGRRLFEIIDEGLEKFRKERPVYETPEK